MLLFIFSFQAIYHSITEPIKRETGSVIAAKFLLALLATFIAHVSTIVMIVANFCHQNAATVSALKRERAVFGTFVFTSKTLLNSIAIISVSTHTIVKLLASIELFQICGVHLLQKTAQKCQPLEITTAVAYLQLFNFVY